MDTEVVALPTKEELFDFIRNRLCDRDRLDPAQTPFFQTPLTRGDRLCGAVFHIQGPRLLRTSAIWSGEDHRIIFYDSHGSRFDDIRLSESPDPEEQAEEPGHSGAAQ